MRKFLTPIIALTPKGKALSEYVKWISIMFNSKSLEDNFSILTTHGMHKEITYFDGNIFCTMYN